MRSRLCYHLAILFVLVVVNIVVVYTEVLFNPTTPKEPCVNRLLRCFVCTITRLTLILYMPYVIYTPKPHNETTFPPTRNLYTYMNAPVCLCFTSLSLFSVRDGYACISVLKGYSVKCASGCRKVRGLLMGFRCCWLGGWSSQPLSSSSSWSFWRVSGMFRDTVVAHVALVRSPAGALSK